MFSANSEESASGRGIVSASAGNNEVYRILLPRLPTGNLVLNSVFLHGDRAVQPFRAPDFRDALRNIVDPLDIVGMGQYLMSHVWMVTCANAAAKAKIVAQIELLVKGRKCLILDPEGRDIKLKLLWLPLHMENRRVAEALAPFGVVRSIAREKWRCAGMEHMETLNREVQLTLHEGMTSDTIPYLLTVFGCQSLVLVPGRAPLCLRCNRVGHVRRQCRTPRCSECRRYGHSTGECVTTYASKLRGPSAADTTLEHVMDVTDVLDASGDLPADKIAGPPSSPGADLVPSPVSPLEAVPSAVGPVLASVPVEASAARADTVIADPFLASVPAAATSATHAGAGAGAPVSPSVPAVASPRADAGAGATEILALPQSHSTAFPASGVSVKRPASSTSLKGDGSESGGVAMESGVAKRKHPDGSGKSSVPMQVPPALAEEVISVTVQSK